MRGRDIDDDDDDEGVVRWPPKLHCSYYALYYNLIVGIVRDALNNIDKGGEVIIEGGTMDIDCLGRGGIDM